MAIHESFSDLTSPVAPENIRASTLVEETNRNVNKIIAIEQAQQSGLSASERIAAYVAAFCGSMAFAWLHLIWFMVWVAFNTLSQRYAFDPFPFTFLTLVVSLEAIFLSTFILISQNMETRLTAQRNHLDLQINMLAEQENTKMLDLLQRIAKKVGIPNEEMQMDAFQEEMRPEKLVDQILSATESAEKNINRIIRP